MQKGESLCQIHKDTKLSSKKGIISHFSWLGLGHSGGGDRGRSAIHLLVLLVQVKRRKEERKA